MKKKINIFNRKKYLKNSTSSPAVFLDRDGTINYDKGYTYKFSQLKFRPYVLRGLKYLNKRKYLIFIVTNQAGIAKGKFELADLLKLNKQLLNYLSKKNIFINEIQFCPFHPRALIKKYKSDASLCKWDPVKNKTVCKKSGKRPGGVLAKIGIETPAEKLGAVGFAAGLLGAFTGAGGFKKKSNK